MNLFDLQSISHSPTHSVRNWRHNRYSAYVNQELNTQLKIIIISIISIIIMLFYTKMEPARI